MYKLSRTEYKKIGPFLERGISFRANFRTGYKNWPISRTGYQF